jgi:hypothetical protein
MDQNSVPVMDVDGKKIPNFELKVVKKRTKLGQVVKSVKQTAKWFKPGGKRTTRRSKSKKVHKKNRHKHTPRRKL